MLAIMVIILCYRVYQVVHPPPATDGGDSFRFPGDMLPADVETPGMPPPVPGPPDSENWTTLWRANPFIYVKPGRGRTVKPGEPDVDLKLLNIQQSADGSYIAWIRSPGRKGWYKEGEAFESYELMTIDADVECVWVFAEEVGRNVEICKGD